MEEAIIGLGNDYLTIDKVQGCPKQECPMRNQPHVIMTKISSVNEHWTAIDPSHLSTESALHIGQALVKAAQ